MNEVELIRNQLAAECQHASAVIAACAASAPGAGQAHSLRQACADYLTSVFARFAERDQRLEELLRTRAPGGEDTRRALQKALAQPGDARETLERLTRIVAAAGIEPAELAARESWQEFARYFESRWCARRDLIDGLFAPHARVSDWRAVAAIDADVILDERRRYAAVRAQLAPGAPLSEA